MFGDSRMSSPALDPNKIPWKRGDVCARDFETVGFVLSYNSDYLEILWHARNNVERVEAVPVHEVGNILRVAHADAASPSGVRTNLENLEEIEALRSVENALANRTFKNDRQRSEANNLLRRAFATDGCAWDREN